MISELFAIILENEAILVSQTNAKCKIFDIFAFWRHRKGKAFHFLYFDYNACKHYRLLFYLIVLKYFFIFYKKIISSHRIRLFKLMNKQTRLFYVAIKYLDMTCIVVPNSQVCLLFLLTTQVSYVFLFVIEHTHVYTFIFLGIFLINTLIQNYYKILKQQQQQQQSFKSTEFKNPRDTAKYIKCVYVYVRVCVT